MCSVALPEPLIKKDDHFPMRVEVACAPSEEAIETEHQGGWIQTQRCSFGGQSVKRTV